MSSEDVSAGTKQKTGAKTSLDVFEGTRRRVNATTSIRKQKIEEMMTSRRKEADSSDDDTANNNNENNNNNNNNNSLGRGTHRYHEQAPDRQSLFEGVKDWISQINPSNNDMETIRQGAFYLRTLVMQDEPDPLPPIRDAGGYEALVALLDCPDDQVLYDALWALTNITDATYDDVDRVLSAGAVEKMVPLLAHRTSEKIRSQAAWCLGNICGNGQKFRQFVQDKDAMKVAVSALQNNGGGGDNNNNNNNTGINGNNKKIETLRNYTFLFAQLNRFKPPPPLSEVSPCLPHLKNMCALGDLSILVDVAWAASFISEGGDERLRALFESGIIPHLLDLFQTKEQRALLPCLRAFGNYSAKDETTYLLFEWNVIPKLGFFLDISTPLSLRKEALWIVSNCVCGTPEQIKIILDNQLMPLVVNCIAHPDFPVRKEAAWAVANLAQYAPLDVIRYLVESCSVLDALCHLLAQNEERGDQLAMEALEPILLKGNELRDRNNGINPYAAKVEELGGSESLQNIAQGVSAVLSCQAIVILENFFGNNDDQNGNDHGNDCGYFDHNNNNQQQNGGNNDGFGYNPNVADGYNNNNKQ